MATTEAATDVRTVRAEPLTPESFAPFGAVLAPEGHTRLPIEIYGNLVDCYKEPFESDQPSEWLITRIRLRDFSVRFLERHHELTQCFIPLGGVPFVSVVARPDAREEDGLPALDEIRAFIVPGHMGIQLHRSVWHEIPLALQQEQVVLVSSHQALTRGLESNLDKSLEIYQLDVEKRNVTERGGFTLRVEMP